MKAMPDGLYDLDILSWSEQQADLLRRLARGEKVNGVDWDNVIEEIEDVGRSELHTVESNLEQMLVHLLKLHIWPDDPSCPHWRGEVVAFQRNARRRFAPSMPQRMKLDELRAAAIAQIQAMRPGSPPISLPIDRLGLDDLLHRDLDDLLNRLAAPA